MLKLETLNDYKRLFKALPTLSDKDQGALTRDLLRNDLFFMLVIGLNRKDMVHPWLLARCKEVEASPDGHLDLWARAHGKDLWMETPVLTTKGFKRHGDLKVGDYVYGKDGKPTKVVATKDFAGNPLYRITFCNDIEIIAGAGHLWEVELHSRKRVSGHKNKRIGRETKIIDTQGLSELVESQVYKIRIKKAKPLQNSERSLPIDPYVLGVWLGDGYSNCGAVCGIDKEIFENIEKAGYELRPPQKLKKEGRHPDYRVRTIKGLRPVLTRQRLLNNKHIPENYLTASVSQRLSLLQGLMDTDGYIATHPKNASAHFNNANKELAEQALTLVGSLGFKARLTKKIIDEKPYYEVSFQITKGGELVPCRLPRKVKSIKTRKQHDSSQHWYIHSVTPISSIVRTVTPWSQRLIYRTNCIQVDNQDGIYLVEKQLIPTHNSSIITLGKTIQDILSSHGDNPDPKWNGIEPTIGIFSCTRPLAKQFLAQIKREFETNEVLRSVFPDVLWNNPGKDAPSWSLDSGIIIKRKSNPKEATIEAWGLVDGQPTGKHFNIMVYDDVVTIDNVRSPDMIEKTTQAWELSLNLGTAGGIYRYIGTRYHYNDTYRAIMERGAAKARLHPATIDGTVDGDPVLLSREILAEKRRNQGPYTFNSQQLLNPVADENQGFSKKWLMFHESSTHTNMNIYILVDPANEKKKTSDFTAITVIGAAADHNFYILEWVRDRLSLTERADELFHLHRKYQPRGVGYERYGMQADIAHIKDTSKRTNYNFKIIELGGSLAKVDRIKALIPIFEQGRMYLPETCFKTDYEKRTQNLTDVFINEEYSNFPVSLHDDMLDSLARILDPAMKVVWPKQKDTSERRYQTKGPKGRNTSAWSV